MRARHVLTTSLLPGVAAISWLGLSPAGSSAAADQPKPACSPDGSRLSITAFDGKFDKDCLAAPADQPFPIDFNNLDRGIPHNVAIYQDETARTVFFKGELIEGPSRITYSVEALPEGTFFFRCDPHPEMNGTFVIGTPRP